jgi:hypothetical protein
LRHFTLSEPQVCANWVRKQKAWFLLPPFIIADKNKYYHYTLREAKNQAINFVFY